MAQPRDSLEMNEADVLATHPIRHLASAVICREWRPAWRQGAIALVKGSRGSAMERVLAAVPEAV